MFFPGSLFLILFILNQTNASRNIVSSLNKACTVQYGTRLLQEGDEISINTKLFKVEDCHLQRAYKACATHLWFVLHIVCEGAESKKGRTTVYNRSRRFVQEKLLSEACCQGSCTLQEITRYCP